MAWAATTDTVPAPNTEGSLLPLRFLRVLFADFVHHYHAERNHQGLGKRLLRPGPTLPAA